MQLSPFFAAKTSINNSNKSGKRHRNGKWIDDGQSCRCCRRPYCAENLKSPFSFGGFRLFLVDCFFGRVERLSKLVVDDVYLRLWCLSLGRGESVRFWLRAMSF